MASSFSVDLQRFAAKARGRMDVVVRKICLDVFKRVVLKTPVDTGRARGNWMCAIGDYKAGESGNLDKGGGATIEAITGVVAASKAGQVVYLTNTLPYIIRLEHGHSQQAPAGMVVTTLREFPFIVERAGGSS